MAAGRSFKDYVSDKCYNGLYEAAKEYAEENWQRLNLNLRKIRSPENPILHDVTVQRVYVSDLPGMEVQFDVGLELELELSDSSRHSDESELFYPWIRVSCKGDISNGLKGWKITQIQPSFDRRNAPPNSLSDALVPYIKYERLDQQAEQILIQYYPEALKITATGEAPVQVQPYVLAERLGLNIKELSISSDSSVLGQVFFSDCDTEMFDAQTGETTSFHVESGTILVAPELRFRRYIGSVNNTIVHECVHWVLHRKVFALEKLFNDNASSITCKVLGGVKAEVAKTATEMMERQANQLTPRIQMPEAPFRSKANEYIGSLMQNTGALYEIDVMEQAIAQLAADFGVSKQAAKIRLVELGFENAIGTFTYIDGHYVKPHGFSKGSLQLNQTFSIPSEDAIMLSLADRELNRLTKSGSYQFVDNHFVLNLPDYITRDETGRTALTDYARTHLDECALVFDMSIRSRDVKETYYTACFLNREENDVEIVFQFHNGWEHETPEKQAELLEKIRKEETEIFNRLGNSVEQSFDVVFKWRNMLYTELSAETGLNEHTIRRIVHNETKPRIENLAAICLGLHLAPMISYHFFKICGVSIVPTNKKDYWIDFALKFCYQQEIFEINEFLKYHEVEIFKNY